jgi:hypothetical protein
MHQVGHGICSTVIATSEVTKQSPDAGSRTLVQSRVKLQRRYRGSQ